MKNQKSNKLVIVLLLVIIAILSVLCILFATGKLTITTNKTNDTLTNDVANNNSENTDDVKINILSIDSAKINPNAINTKLAIEGKMELSYNENIHNSGMGMSGYCITDKEQTILITGPASGAASLHDSDKTFSLSEVISPGIHYDIDWNNIKIKSCVLEKAIIYSYDELEECKKNIFI